MTARNNIIQFQNAFELRNFLNGIPAKDLRRTTISATDHNGLLNHRIYGLKVTHSTLEDGLEVTDYAF